MKRFFRIALACASAAAAFAGPWGCSSDNCQPDMRLSSIGPGAPVFDSLPVPPPPQGVGFRMIVYGDSQAGYNTLEHPASLVAEIHEALIGQFALRSPRYVFHTGDLVETGSNLALWDEWQSITAPLDQCPDLEYYPTLGNHEAIGDADFSNYFDYTGPLPQNGSPGYEGQWYCVAHPGALFVVLRVSSSGSAPAGFNTMKSWTSAVLSDPAYAGRFKFVFYHICPHSSGFRQTDVDYAKQLDPIFQANGVDAVFNGHTHAYERLEIGGIPYIVTGGGGAGLHDHAEFMNWQSVVWNKCHNYVEVQVSRDGSTAKIKAYKLKVELLPDVQFEVIDAITLIR